MSKSSGQGKRGDRIKKQGQIEKEKKERKGGRNRRKGTIMRKDKQKETKTNVII